jgi:hypothetical protein
MLKFLLKDNVLLLVFIPFLIVTYLFLNESYSYFENKQHLNLGFWGDFSIQKIENYFIVLNVLTLSINAFLINFLFNKNGFYEKNSYIIAFLYVILLSYYQTFYILDGLLISQTFFILALNQIFKLDYNTEGKKVCFNVGFLVGISSTFFPPALLSLPILWMMVTRIRPLVFRELSLVFIGMLTPMIYAISYNYIFLKKIVIKILNSTDPYSQKEIVFLISLVLFSILVLISFIGIRAKSSKSSIRFRKNISILNLYLVFGIILGVLDWIFYQQYEWFCFIVIPIVLYLPFSYYMLKNAFISQLLFYVIFIFSVIKFFI